jgi:nucleotide-binding universal stress UspA family protein
MTTRLIQSAGRQAARGGGPVPFRRILVPLDGSELAERALPFARSLAHLVGGNLILARVADGRRPFGDPVGAQIKAAAEAEAYLERLADGQRAGYVAERSLPYGDPATEIAKLAGERSADLIVMSTHGRSGLGRALLGSVADTLVRRTALPLLLVRAGLPLDRWEHGLRRILVPLDGSELAEAALPRVAALAQASGARVTLLQVVGPPTPELQPYEVAVLPEDDEALAEQARRYLAGAAARLSERGVGVESEVAFGWPAERIGAAAAEHHADLIAMSTHGRGGLDRLIVGSVADRVLRRAEVPVLLVRGA